MIVIKTIEEIDRMRAAGKLLAKILNDARDKLRPGVTTNEINDFTEKKILAENAIPAFKGYKGFPASVCISINEEVVHGIPSERKLKLGDIVSLDSGLKYDGYHADAAITQAIGRVNGRVKKLLDVTKKALSLGISQAIAGNHLSDISCAIQRYVESMGFSVVRDFVGHGIGKIMHEEPEVPNFGNPNSGPILKEGMTLAVEPMVNMGTWEIQVLDNNWTAVTKDRLFSAHFEHTIAITRSGPQILTQ